MGLKELTSKASFWKGFDYFESNQIISDEQISENIFKAKIKGSGENIYDVYIDTEKPRKSSCTCKHAAGRKVICKHMMALFFKYHPEEVTEVREIILEEERKLEEIGELEVERFNEILEELKDKSVEELRIMLANYILDSEREDCGWNEYGDGYFW